MSYETKDSGKRQEFATGMVRDTQDGKPRFDLIFPEGVPFGEQILTRFAALMARGAEKYTERNWELARTEEELNRARGSALRHLIQWYVGETDEDHAAGAMFNLMAAETIRWKMRAEASVALANELAHDPNCGLDQCGPGRLPRKGVCNTGMKNCTGFGGAMHQSGAHCPILPGDDDEGRI